MRKLIISIAVLAIGGAAIAAYAIAGDTGPTSPNANLLTYVAGNPVCPADTVASFKVEPVANGTYNGLITITNFSGKTLD